MANARDGDVEADLASLDVLLKVPGGGTTLGEGRSAVAVCALRRNAVRNRPADCAHVFRKTYTCFG